MKAITRFSLLALVVAGPCLMATRPIDVMTDLGISSDKLRQDVFLNLKEPKWFFFNASGSMRQMARRIPESSRAATVRALGKVVRLYVESTQFRQEWLQDLRVTYPYDDSYREETQAERQQLQKMQQAAVDQQVASMDQVFLAMDPAILQLAIRSQLAREEQQLASLSGNERTAHSGHVTALKKMLTLAPAECKKQYLAYLKQQYRAEAAHAGQAPEIDKERLAEQRRKKAEFDAHADFRPLLKQRLQDFIALANSVDFEARLVPMGYKHEFANPVYQRKPAEWKFLYRLGKEPVAEARLMAQQWLAELH
ncbi:hypothetical protein HNV11_02470 [Spirosoma taeanense]|uniref:DUF3106 domain-containing protein n=1 Tax=Spirosoma taeanense TaxID=2735870 RepID=A0A6M5Y4J3_9BACT|nr:hypothetical protein [Spirosoma taeanense]QJW88316.1 hypothetical protein HNV11_02470 [Spirosoma taeanense]